MFESILDFVVPFFLDSLPAASLIASTIFAFFRIRLPAISNSFFEISTSSILTSAALIFTEPLSFRGSGLLISSSLSSTLPFKSMTSGFLTSSFTFFFLPLAVSLTVTLDTLPSSSTAVFGGVMSETLSSTLPGIFTDPFGGVTSSTLRVTLPGILTGAVGSTVTVPGIDTGFLTSTTTSASVIVTLPRIGTTSLALL